MLWVECIYICTSSFYLDNIIMWLVDLIWNCYYGRFQIVLEFFMSCTPWLARSKMHQHLFFVFSISFRVLTIIVAPLLNIQHTPFVFSPTPNLFYRSTDSGVNRGERWRSSAAAPHHGASPRTRSQTPTPSIAPTTGVHRQIPSTSLFTTPVYMRIEELREQHQHIPAHNTSTTRECGARSTNTKSRDSTSMQVGRTSLLH